MLESNECWLYEKGAEMEKIAAGVNTAGLVWGDTQCLDMEQCSVSTETSCQNKIMSQLPFK